MNFLYGIDKIDEIVRKKSSKEHGFSSDDILGQETASSNPVTYKELLRILICYMDNNELIKLQGFISGSNGELKEYADTVRHFISNKNSLPAEINPTVLTSTQKLLLIALLIVNNRFKGGDTCSNDQLNQIMDILGVSKEFYPLVLEYLKTVEVSSTQAYKDIISLFFSPPAEMINWITDLVYYSYNEGKYINKKVLWGLNPVEYEHPTDRTALNALEGTPGLEPLIKKFYQYGIDKLLKVQYTGSNMKITSKNLPRLYNALITVCKTIHINKIPDFYIMQGDEINAFTTGVDRYIIVINEGCAEKLTYDELLFVLGHEVGHIKSQHVLYYQLASVLPLLGNIIGNLTLGVGELLSTGIQLALLNWQRKSEFTSDRAGLLACQNLDAAITAMMKIAGYPPSYYSTIDPEDFIEQSKNFEGFDEDKLDKIAKVLSVMSATHPWTVMRAAEMVKWTESGRYEAIIKKYGLPAITSGNNTSKANKGSFCIQCGNRISENMQYCTNCGKKLF